MKKLLLALFIVLFPITTNAATVSRIDVAGNKRMDTESVRILTGVKVGDNVTNVQVNQIAKKLQESGYFGRVDVQMSGNTLKINVSESPIVNMVTVEGNDEIATDDLNRLTIFLCSSFSAMGTIFLLSELSHVKYFSLPEAKSYITKLSFVIIEPKQFEAIFF